MARRCGKAVAERRSHVAFERGSRGASGPLVTLSRLRSLSKKSFSNSLQARSDRISAGKGAVERIIFFFFTSTSFFFLLSLALSLLPSLAPSPSLSISLSNLLLLLTPLPSFPDNGRREKCLPLSPPKNK